MQLTQRCQYALRALFELARHAAASPDDPVLPACAVAQAQAIPKRFLDGILLELRQAGFVEARRGKRGGFLLARPAGEITVGALIRFYNGAMSPVDCRTASDAPCPLFGGCVFQSLWDQARAALEGVYDAVSLAELVTREGRLFPPRRAMPCASDHDAPPPVIAPGKPAPGTPAPAPVAACPACPACPVGPAGSVGSVGPAGAQD